MTFVCIEHRRYLPVKKILLTGSLSVMYTSHLEVREMEILFAISVTSAVLWLAFGKKKDWTG